MYVLSRLPRRPSQTRAQETYSGEWISSRWVSTASVRATPRTSMRTTIEAQGSVVRQNIYALTLNSVEHFEDTSEETSIASVEDHMTMKF